SADVITRAVARAFELLLGLEPSRGAAKMGALGENRVETLLGAYDPGAEFLLEFFAHLTDDVVIREAGFELRGREKEHAWERAADGGERPEGGDGADAGPAELAHEIAPTP